MVPFSLLFLFVSHDLHGISYMAGFSDWSVKSADKDTSHQHHWHSDDGRRKHWNMSDKYQKPWEQKTYLRKYIKKIRHNKFNPSNGRKGVKLWRHYLSRDTETVQTNGWPSQIRNPQPHFPSDKANQLHPADNKSNTITPIQDLLRHVTAPTFALPCLCSGG